MSAMPLLVRQQIEHEQVVGRDANNHRRFGPRRRIDRRGLAFTRMPRSVSSASTMTLRIVEGHIGNEAARPSIWTWLAMGCVSTNQA